MSEKHWTKLRDSEGLWLVLHGNKVAKIVDTRMRDDVLVDFIVAGLEWAASKKSLEDIGVEVD